MQLLTLSKQSLKQPPVATETYIPLWCADGTSVNTQSMTYVYLCDGTTSLASSSSGVNTRLFTLNSSSLSTIKYAFEATIYTSNVGMPLTASLWDITSGTQVTESQITTTSTTAIVVRSGQFNLVPGNVYGVVIKTPNNAYYAYIVDASLIVFGS